MRNTYDRFKKLTSEQQFQAVGYFLGGITMAEGGFTDSESRPDYQHAKYAVDLFEEAMRCKSVVSEQTEAASNCASEAPEIIPSGHPEQVAMASGAAASSVGPSFHLIPTVALERLAERFALGVERKGDKSWNALSDNQQCLTDKKFLIERLSHIIHHALKLRDKLNADDSEAIQQDDDAGAIAWGGM